LPLAGGGRLGVADVLALAPAPARVVLSGCDAAKSDGDAEGLGLAQAFVAAGADEVLAPVRPVADALAAKLAARIHRDHDPPPLAVALRDAAIALRNEDPGGREDWDWAAFRVLAR
jgi:CHAT domain-containing protein